MTSFRQVAPDGRAAPVGPAVTGAVTEAPAPTGVTATDLAPGVVAWLGQHGMPNAVTVEGTDGIVVIDSLFTPRHAAGMMARLRERTSKPVLALVNTHFHGDHTLGNATIPTSRIIAHRAVRDRLSEGGPAYLHLLCGVRPDLAPEIAGLEFVLPTEVIDDALDLDAGQQPVQVRAVRGPAHTTGDLVVILPAQRILVASDLVFNGILPVARDADLAGWIAALDDLAALKPDIVVPGHGPVGGAGLLAGQRDVLNRVAAAARAHPDSRAAARYAVLAEVGSLLHAEERVDAYLDLLLAERSE
jgi:cyclase